MKAGAKAAIARVLWEEECLILSGSMKARTAVCLFLSGLLMACSYDSIRMHERSRCGAMPQSQAQACYGRTQDTKAEYDAKRRALKNSARKDKEMLVDERYDQWIP
jgi:hypothetical protein